MKKQRSIVLFLVKFFAAYFILFTVYSLYLHHTQKKMNYIVVHLLQLLLRNKRLMS